MKKQLLLTALLFALVAPVMAQGSSAAPQTPMGPGGGPNKADIRHDQREINKDKRELAKDRAELRQDRRDRNHEVARVERHRR